MKFSAWCRSNAKLLTPLKSDAIHHLYWEESKAPDIGPPENISSMANKDRKATTHRVIHQRLTICALLAVPRHSWVLHTSESKTYTKSRSAYEDQHRQTVHVEEANPSSDKSGVNTVTNGTINATSWKVSDRSCTSCGAAHTNSRKITISKP